MEGRLHQGDNVNQLGQYLKSRERIKIPFFFLSFFDVLGLFLFCFYGTGFVGWMCSVNHLLYFMSPDPSSFMRVMSLLY